MHVRVRGAGGPLAHGQIAWLYSGPNRRHRAVQVVGVEVRNDTVPPIELYRVTESMLNDAGCAVRSPLIEVQRSQLTVVEAVRHRFEPGAQVYQHVSRAVVAAQLLDLQSSGEPVPGYLIIRSGDGCCPNRFTLNEQLSAQYATRCRSLVARAKRLAPDGADIQFACKKLSASMTSPSKAGWESPK